MITGKGPEGGSDPVWAKLLRRATDVARFVGAVLQAVYYALKVW
ncbi:hypothetical protein [Streptomyces olivochromogenes]|nr:hypothetical protein [Streptomyces olivochromogenes]